MEKNKSDSTFSETKRILKQENWTEKQLHIFHSIAEDRILKLEFKKRKLDPAKEEKLCLDWFAFVLQNSSILKKETNENTDKKRKIEEAANESKNSDDDGDENSDDDSDEKDEERAKTSELLKEFYDNHFEEFWKYNNLDELNSFESVCDCDGCDEESKTNGFYTFGITGDFKVCSICFKPDYHPDMDSDCFWGGHKNFYSTYVKEYAETKFQAFLDQNGYVQIFY